MMAGVTIMEIIIGSNNPTKIKAVKNVFPEANLKAFPAHSGVSAQPFSDEETRQGAVNRAMECAKSADGGYGIGLEGGVMYLGRELFLCNWGALAAPDGRIFTGSGARVLLPEDIRKGLESGKELGELMDDFAERQEVRMNEGAIGIFTNDRISRMDMFTHVVELLRGQLEFSDSGKGNGKK